MSALAHRDGCSIQSVRTIAQMDSNASSVYCDKSQWVHSSGIYKRVQVCAQETGAGGQRVGGTHLCRSEDGGEWVAVEKRARRLTFVASTQFFFRF
jgi:hypothetical protein